MPKLTVLEVRTSAENRDAVLGFYSTLFGEELARSLTDELESHHMPITPDGTWLTIGVRSGREDDPAGDPLPIVCHFAVDDLQAAVDTLTKAGGRVLTEPISADVAPRARDYYAQRVNELNSSQSTAADGSFVSVAYVADPDGNVIALMQVAEDSKFWFGLDGGSGQLSDRQRVGHRRTVEVGRRFAAGETL